MIRSFKGHTPKVDPGAYVDEAATLIGEVEVACGASIWPGASIRGDMGPIRIGRNTSIQDNAVCHNTREESETVIGDDVSVGHCAVLHGCRVSDNCVVGMGAIVMDNAEIGEWSIVAAGAVVTQNKKFPPKSIIAGVPAKVIKEVDEETMEYIRHNGEEYQEMLRHYRESGR